MPAGPLVFVLSLILLVPQGAASGKAPGPPPAPDPRLTVADIVKITSLDVHQVARGSASGAGFNLNFADATGLVVGVNFGTETLYDRAKAQTTMNIMGKNTPMPLVHAAVPGIGDEAFDSPPGGTQWVIYAKKGHQSFAVSTFFTRAGTPKLPIAQLVAIAKIIASRL